MTKLEVVQRRPGYQPATPKVEDHFVIYRYDWPKLHLLVSPITGGQPDYQCH